MKLFKNEKEKTTEERIRKARRDTHQAIYIALASIGISLAQIISAFVKAYLGYLKPISDNFFDSTLSLKYEYDLTSKGESAAESLT